MKKSILFFSIALLSLLPFLSSVQVYGNTLPYNSDDIQTTSVVFPVECMHAIPDTSDSHTDVGKLVSRLRGILSDPSITIHSVIITGYSSPDGRYSYNDMLAKARANNLRNYLKRSNLVPSQLITTTSVSEDWDGLVAFVEQASVQDMPQRDGVLEVAKSNLQPSAKERTLRARYPEDFRFLLKNCMPGLRRIECKINFVAKDRSTNDAQNGKSFVPTASSGRAAHSSVCDTLNIFFPLNGTSVEMNYAGNAARWNSFENCFHKRFASPRPGSVHFDVYSGSSPEGTPNRNRWLGEQRGLALQQLIGKRLNQQADYVVVHNEAARWDDFRDMIAASQEPWREEVLRILDMPASEDSKTYDPREAKLRALHDGEVWSVLMDKYFPMLRSGAVAVVDWQSAREADPVQQVEVATVDTIPETQNQDAGESVAVTENNPSGDKEPVKDTTQGTAQNTTQEGTQGTAQEEQKIDADPYSDNQSNNDNTLNNNNIDNNAEDAVSIDKETEKDAAQDGVQNTQVTVVLPSTKQNSEVPLDTTKQSRKDVTQSPSNTVSDEAFLDTSYHSLQDLVLPHAKWKRSDIASVPRLGGFVVGSYKYDNRAGEHGGEGFGVRMARLYVDGSVMRDFKYRLQVDFAGTPRLLDAFATWSHWKELEVKIGQFKRCFTFENPYNPWDVGFGDYSQLTRKFAGYGDRVGEEPVGGRDIGLQIQGDAFRSKKDGHSHLHYAVAVYNGQGMNHKDLNRQKDFIGTLQWSPVRDLYIGVFGWMGNWKSDDGVNVNRNRFAAGVKYEGSKNHWTVRAEYARSYGHKAEDFSGDVAVGSSSWTGGRLSDAWYATVGVPVWRWIKIYGKYDVYRDYATKATMHTIYAASVNLQPHKNLLLQLQYNFHQLGITTTGCYHQAWLQAYIRF